jgi:acetolactate synthase-1/2/3 large subunit
MKVSEYVASFLADQGVRHVFMVSGGGAMHLNDAFGRESRMQVICNHHEQACAMAAEGYARVSGHVGVLNVTTGPGSINALNGVFGAWTDSIPLLVISGQVKQETCMTSYQLPGLRQLGDQEADIISMVQGITKYAVMVTDPLTIRFHLEKAMYLAKSGRPGPCWIDIPIDVQAAKIDPSVLPGFTPVEPASSDRSELLTAQCREVIERLMTASRPVLMVGTGVRLAGAVETFERIITKLRIPVTTAWTAHDLIPTDHELYCGRPGTVGDRPGNFTVQNSDLLIVIGSRLNIRQVSYNWKAFARHAYKVQVDVDRTELSKPTVRPDLAICCDATAFLEELERQLDRLSYDPSLHAGWLAWCKERVVRYPVVLPRHREFNGAINPYHFLDQLCRALEPDDVIVCGNGAACVVTFQVAHIKRGQRLFCNSGSASMGYDLPASIGAAVAREGKRVICLAGDGSIQMNIQELQTLVHHQFPVKIFVLDNNGYLSIRQSQKNFFNFLVGESEASGVSFPDMVQIGQAYGIPSLQVEGPDFLPSVERVLAAPGPQICQVKLDAEQQFEPKLSSRSLPDGRIVSAPLEDLYPFLERDELLGNLLVPPMES